MSKDSTIAKLYDVNNPILIPLFQGATYPWELLPRIRDYIRALIAEGIPGYTQIAEDVLVGEDVKLYPNVTVEGPTILGSGTEIRPGAFLRGSVITGEKCVIGNSTELKNCVLMDHVQVPHYNYVGDSVLGNFAHMGAGAVCSNLKADGQPVVIHGEPPIETGLRKVGAFLADHADVGCGCVLNPGTVLGRYTTVYPLTAVRGVIPAHMIVKSSENMVVRRP